MKKITFLVMALLCGITFSNCIANEPQKQDVDQLQIYKDSLLWYKQRLAELEREAKPPSMPCMTFLTDDDNYFALGISDGEFDSQEAMRVAMSRAQSDLAQQVGDNIETNKVYQVCREVTRDVYGNWVVYIALKYPKK